MTTVTKAYDPAEYLTTPEDMAAYIDTYLEDGTTEEIRAAIATVVRTQNVSELAATSGVSRQGI